MSGICAIDAVLLTRAPGSEEHRCPVCGRTEAELIRMGRNPYERTTDSEAMNRVKQELRQNRFF